MGHDLITIYIICVYYERPESNLDIYLICDVISLSHTLSGRSGVALVKILFCFCYIYTLFSFFIVHISFQ